MPTEQRPNFFLAGVQKAGTSALTSWLQTHPEVFMAFPKEPGYLAFGERGYVYRDGYGHIAPASDYVVRSERDYLNLFQSVQEHERIRGEASTWYFALPGMARRLRAFNPQAKVVVVLRNPVERAYSAFCHARRDGLEPCEDFAAALAAEAGRGEVEFLLRYRAMGLYADALEAYYREFSADKLLILLYDDIKREPRVQWARMCRFLCIDENFEPAPMRHLNRSGQPRFALLQKLLRSQRFKREVLKRVPYTLAVKIRERVDRINLRPLPPLDTEIAAELAAYYRQDILRVEALLGRDLDHWLQA